MDIVRGELSRKIVIAERRSLRDQQRLIAGRQILFLIYEHFRLNRNLGMVCTITDLAAIRYLGDDRLEIFKNDWEQTVSGMTINVPEDMLLEMMPATGR